MAAEEIKEEQNEIPEDVAEEATEENASAEGESACADNEADAKIKALEEQLAAEKEKLLRTAAEYANFRSRSEREKLGIYSNAVSDTIKELLPIADSLDRARESSKDAPEEFKKGLEMINNQLLKAFEKLNITAFGEVGDVFDPELHNAISSVDNEEIYKTTSKTLERKKDL